MFTGIIETIGTIKVLNLPQITIVSDLSGLVVGESIATNGVCLTVTSASGGTWSADISQETFNKTTLGGLRPGGLVNLERAMLATGRFGGHIVQGHVDGTATVKDRQDLDHSTVVSFELEHLIARYLVPKGSVSVDGVSLTVSSLEAGAFSVALVPHTLEATNLNLLDAGQRVNIEVDLLAKYIESFILERKT
ncbi:MAG: riboflavin synthase [Actinomycetota bacterium]